MTREKDSVWYGDGEGSIYTPEGKKRLWDEEMIIYIGGVHAFKITPRDKLTPLVEIYHEDDGQIFSSEASVVFDAGWLRDLRELIDVALDKMNLDDA